MSSVIEVNVGGLAYDDKTKSHVVILREAGGHRVLPIWIGPAEASAIMMEIAGKKFQRPLTHDLMATIVRGLKATVSKIIISDLRDNTFYANIVLEREKDNEIVNIRLVLKGKLMEKPASVITSELFFIEDSESEAA